MDADDWIEATFYESYFNEIKNEEPCDIIFSGYIRELPFGDYKKTFSFSIVHSQQSFHDNRISI